MSKSSRRTFFLVTLSTLSEVFTRLDNLKFSLVTFFFFGLGRRVKGELLDDVTLLTFMFCDSTEKKL